jgi:hypothetical protein
VFVDERGTMRVLLAVIILTGLVITYAQDNSELKRRTHPLDDYNVSFLEIAGVPLVGFDGDDYKPGLQWLCTADRDFDLRVWVDRDTAQLAVSSDAYIRVRYRFKAYGLDEVFGDENKPSVSRDWGQTQYGYTAYAYEREKINFTKTAIGNKTTVLFSIMNQAGTEFFAEFKLTGLKRKIELLGCVDLTADD